jgi:hypothetical protein
MAKSPTLTALCAGYEQTRWRAEELVSDLFDRHLTTFALSFTDWNGINSETAAHALRKAAQAIYDTDKYRRRGEFGELILHATVRDFFGAQPAVSKLHFKDSANDTVKGFDSVHLVENGGRAELWLGEVKYYSSLTRAIFDSAAELNDHLGSGFLRKEFVAITNKLDDNWPYSSEVRGLLNRARTLDEILPRLVVPVLLTYDSRAVSTNNETSDEYLAALEQEAQDGWEKFAAEVGTSVPVALHLILVPLGNKERLTNLFHQKLQVWRHL